MAMMQSLPALRRGMTGALTFLAAMGAAAAEEVGAPPGEAMAGTQAAFYGEKFEPPAGRMYAGVGQSVVGNVVAAVAGSDPQQRPIILSFYDHLIDFKTNPKHSIGPEVSIAYDFFPGSIMNYGVQLPKRNPAELARVSDGSYDAAIDRLGRQLKGLRQKLLVRIGYEFEGTHNDYPARLWKAAFKRIHDRWDALAVDNVAYVMDAGTLKVSMATIEAYYPGDTYIDWMGFNYFFGPPVPVTGDMYRFAAAHRKPILMAEVSKSDDKPPIISKSQYMQNFAAGMAQSTAVKGFSLINHNWRWTQLQIRNWGDNLYSDDSAAMGIFRQALTSPRYVTLGSAHYFPLALHVTPVLRAPLEVSGPYDASKTLTFARGGYRASPISTGTITMERLFWRTCAGEMRIDITVPAASSGYLFARTIAPAGADFHLDDRQVVSGVVTAGDYVKLKYTAADSADAKVHLLIDDRGTSLKLGDFGVQRISGSALPAPTGLARLASTSVHPRLGWKAVPNAFRYNIYRNAMYVGSAATNASTDTTAPSGTHGYRVTTVSATQGEGNLSDALRIVR
jgi:hypothetical protein